MMGNTTSAFGKFPPQLIGLAALFVFPLVNPSDYVQHLVTIAMLYGVLASSWDLSMGYGGIFNFGHMALFALGGYAAGVSTVQFGLSPWLGIVAGAMAAVIGAVLVSLPVLRVKGIYVCLVTFAFGQLCHHLILGQSKYTGGSNGLVMIPPITIGNYSFASSDKLAYYYLALALLVVSTYFLRRIVTSHFGLSIVALRDFEDLAISRGVGVARQRLLTMAGSAVFTGATGAIYAYYLSSVSPELFGFSYLATVLSMILLGGTATIYGPIVGAFFLTFISEFLVSLGPWRFVIIALLMIVTIWRFPDGLLSGLKILAARLVPAPRTGQGAG